MIVPGLRVAQMLKIPRAEFVAKRRQSRARERREGRSIPYNRGGHAGGRSSVRRSSNRQTDLQIFPQIAWSAFPGTPAFPLVAHRRPDHFISKELVHRGIWEPYETQVLLSHLREGSVFLDLGANIGYYTVLASKRCGPGGRVHAFEPEPAKLRRSSATWPSTAART